MKKSTLLAFAATLCLLFPLSAMAANGIDTADGVDLPISAGGNQAMTVKTNGNVGIGTTNPTSKLQVEGKVAVNGDLAVTGSALINIASCGDHQVMKGISNGKAVCVTMSYGGAYMANVDGSCRYANPITGSCSCPNGATGYGSFDFISGGSWEYSDSGQHHGNNGILGTTCVY